MTFNNEQLAILAKHEDILHRAYFSGWAKRPTEEELNDIFDTYVEATGDKHRKKTSNCMQCYYNLFKDVATLYYADIEAKKKVVALSPENEEARKLALKTKRIKKTK